MLEERGIKVLCYDAEFAAIQLIQQYPLNLLTKARNGGKIDSLFQPPSTFCTTVPYVPRAFLRVGPCDSVVSGFSPLVAESDFCYFVSIPICPPLLPCRKLVYIFPQIGSY